VGYVADKIVGMTKPQWMPSRPDDQTEDDKKSLVFDSMPIEADTEILGYPVAKLRLSADVPVAKVAIRLSEVLPDGKSWLVSYGVLNLTHRDSHEHPTALKPHELYDVEVPCYMVAHRFKKGSRIRAALSESLWPLLWPSPQLATLTVDLGASRLILPVRSAPAAEAAFPIPIKQSRGSSPYTHSEMGPGTEGHLNRPLSTTLIEQIGTTVEEQSNESFVIKEGDPNSCVWKQENMTGWKRGEWQCSVSAAFELTSTREEFHLKEVLRASRGDLEIFRREKSGTIKRDLI
jgi:hypothetical protein